MKRKRRPPEASQLVDSLSIEGARDSPDDDVVPASEFRNKCRRSASLEGGPNKVFPDYDDRMVRYGGAIEY
jgi:hypothetical protein